MNFQHASHSAWRQLGLGIALVLLHAGVISAADVAKARTQVATLDGVPVYHWHGFKSVVADDVDRALILREFRRKHFRVPDALVNDEVTRKAGGDRQKFEQSLRKKGMSLAEFRQFAEEEICLQAMLYQNARSMDKRADLQANWLAKLRTGAEIKRTRTSPLDQ